MEDTPYLFETGELSTAVLTGKTVAKKDLIIEQKFNNRKIILWGDNNLLPQEILEHIEQDEVVYRANEFNKATHFGLGLTYFTERRIKNEIVKEYIEIPEVDDWFEENDIQRLYLEMVNDYESLSNPFTGMVLSKDKSKIARVLRKQAPWCRWGKQADSGKVESMFYHSDWSETGSENEAVQYDVLSTFDPLNDLLSRSIAKEYIFRLKPIASNRFFYDFASVEVLINSGNFEDKKLTKTALRALLKNQMGALWHIEITEKYLAWKMGKSVQELLEVDAKIKQSEFTKVKAEIDKWLSGPENQGKTLLTLKYLDKDTRTMESGVIITPLASKLKTGDWIPGMQQYQADTYTAMGVDPSTVGISNQKDGMNSGSEKKNAFSNTQATIMIERINTLAPLYFAARFNGWTKKYKGFKLGVMDKEISQPLNSNPDASK